MKENLHISPYRVTHFLIVNSAHKNIGQNLFLCKMQSIAILKIKSIGKMFPIEMIVICST